MLRVCFRTFLIWALSIGIHAGLIFVLKAQRNKPESIKSVAQKVSLHIRDRSSPQNERGISPHSKPKELRSSGSASGKPRRAMSAKSEAKSRPSVVGESIAGYASLLPGVDWRPVVGAAEQDAADAVRGSPRAQFSAETLRGRFYIPLSVRKNAIKAQAFGKLTLLGPRKVKVDYIDGDPYCRAAMFEGLKAPSVWPALNELFTEVNGRELLLSLSYDRRIALPGQPSGHDFTARVAGIKVSIRHVFSEALTTSELAPALPTIGMVLSDSLAEKSMNQDRRDAARLTQSPAYTGSIRDFVLNYTDDSNRVD